MASNQFYTILLIALMFSFFTLAPLGKRIHDKVFYSDYSVCGHIVGWLVSVVMFFMVLGALNAIGFSPFIYFRF